MEQMRERELLPCPFCGGAAELFNWATPHSPLWKVGCRSCDAWIDPDQRSIEACHDAWNIRADMQPEIDRRVAEEKSRLLAGLHGLELAGSAFAQLRSTIAVRFDVLTESWRVGEKLRKEKQP